MLGFVANQPRSRPEIADHLGLKSRSGHLYKAIDHLRNLDLVELTIPDKPQSRNQKLRITEAGRRFGLSRSHREIAGRPGTDGRRRVLRSRSRPETVASPGVLGEPCSESERHQNAPELFLATSAGKPPRKASDRIRPRGRYGAVEDAVVHQGGVALVGQPQVSVRSLLETSGLTTFHALNSVMALLRVQGGHESEAEHRQPNHS